MSNAVEFEGAAIEAAKYLGLQPDVSLRAKAGVV